MSNRCVFRSFVLSALLGLGSFPSLGAATYYVNPASGANVNDGSAAKPFQTVKPAIERAQAGDTILMVRVSYPLRESIEIINKSGEAGKPITLDAHGNTFTGSDPINPADWTEVRPGLFRNNHLLPGLKPPALVDGKSVRDLSTDSKIDRYFFLWNGVMNRMGRSSKGRRPPLPEVAQLQPGQWTYAENEAAFYLTITPGTKLGDHAIEAPVRPNGVTIAGDCAHWVIRNVNTTHVINDGFNIHGRSKDLVYENITATECGDDGFSSHANFVTLNESSECVIRGFVSRLNSTGLANMGSGVYENLVLEDNYGVNLLIIGKGTHEIHDSVISAQAPADGWGGIMLDGASGYGSPSVRLLDCKVRWPATQNPSGKPPVYITPPEGNPLKIAGTTKLGPPDPAQR